MILIKGTLLQFGIEVELLEAFEDSAHMVVMVSLIIVPLVVSLVTPAPSPSSDGGMACPEPITVMVRGDRPSVDGQAEQQDGDAADRDVERSEQVQVDVRVLRDEADADLAEPGDDPQDEGRCSQAPMRP